MEVLEALRVAEPAAELSEAARRQAVARWEADILSIESFVDRRDARPILRVAIEVCPVLVGEPKVGRGVDIVDGPADRREPTRDERLPKAFRRDRQVRHRREATERLAEDAPWPAAELAPDELGVPDDGIGSGVPEVPGLRRPRLSP